MRKPGLAVVLGGLLMTLPVSGAMSQNLASAPNPKTELVFMETGSATVPPSAMGAVRKAAEAARQQHAVRVEGRADDANAVRQALIGQGAPADQITVRAVAARPLVKAGDGVSDPTDRKVEIKF